MSDCCNRPDCAIVEQALILRTGELAALEASTGTQIRELTKQRDRAWEELHRLRQLMSLEPTP